MSGPRDAQLLELVDIDLREDPLAATYVKDEIVSVAFARADGTLMSRVGPNQYRRGDALLSGADGDTWCVARNRFDLAYQPLPPLSSGEPGDYRNVPRPVLARQIHEPFAVRRTVSGDWLRGEAGDWLLQYAPGDHGIAAAARFAQVYRAAAAS